jgi:hypothetical protein
MTQRNRIETTRIHCNHDLVSRLAEAILPDTDAAIWGISGHYTDGSGGSNGEDKEIFSQMEFIRIFGL